MRVQVGREVSGERQKNQAAESDVRACTNEREGRQDLVLHSSVRILHDIRMMVQWQQRQ